MTRDRQELRFFKNLRTTVKDMSYVAYKRGRGNSEEFSGELTHFSVVEVVKVRYDDRDG